MKLYELISAIETFEFEFDDETGEILNGQELEDLEMELDKKKEQFALWYKNLRAEAEALKQEERTFTMRRRTAEKKAEWVKETLDDMCHGEGFKTEKAAVNYRKSESVKVDNNQSAVAWLIDNDHTECVKIADPEVRKTEVKKLLKSGAMIDGLELVDNLNIQIR